MKKMKWMKKGIMAQKESLILLVRLKGAGPRQEFVLAKQDFF